MNPSSRRTRPGTAEPVERQTTRHFVKRAKLRLIAPFSAVLVAAQAWATATGYSIGLNFGAEEYPDAGGASSGAGRLEAAEMAGVDGVKQANWNNLDGNTGSVLNLKADNGGASVDTAVTVNWSSYSTWSSTGRGEENNGFAADSPHRQST